MYGGGYFNVVSIFIWHQAEYAGFLLDPDRRWIVAIETPTAGDK